MKKFKYVLILIIAFALWYFIYELDNTKPIKSIGSETIAETVDSKKATPETKGKIVELSDELLLNTAEARSKLKIDPMLTYLQAYRNYIFFNKCYGVIKDINNNVSPIIRLKRAASSDFYSLISDSKKQVTALQLQYFSDYSDRCHSFLDNDDETYTSAYDRLYNLYNEIEPKTNEEKNLATGLELLDKYNNGNIQLQKSKIGTSLLNEAEINKIKSEIRTIGASITEYKANPDWKTNQQIQIIIKDLTQQISGLRLQLSNNRVIDSEQVKIIDNQVKQLNLEMVDFLKQNNSPDILILYARYIFYPYGRNNTAIIQGLRHELNIYDSYLMLSLYDVGIKLTACAMNYPCDDQSEFISDYCIRGSYSSACGKTLEDFYFNEYLGPNQLEDVSKYFNYILEHYAKK